MDYKQQQSLNEAINKIFYSEKDTTLCLDEALDEAEDNTAAIAKQVKKAVKKYTTGKLVVRSKGGKTRFIMVLSDKIDNELRKMMLDVMSPNANVRDEDDISYGNISDKIISASADAWVKALGLKESVLDEVYNKPTSIASSVESRKKVTKVLKKKGIGFHTSKGDIMVNPKNLIAAKSALNKEFAGDFETNSGMKLKATKKVGISDEVELDEAWTADSVIRNAEIGSKKGYGINIKKTGEITKTPYKHMLMKTKRGGNVIVTFDFGKDEFEGTPESVALYVNKILGIKESVLDEVASRETETAKNIAKQGKKLGDWVNKTYYEYEGNLWVLGGFGNDAVNRGPIDKAKKDLSDILLKKLKF